MVKGKNSCYGYLNDDFLVYLVSSKMMLNKEKSRQVTTSSIQVFIRQCLVTYDIDVQRLQSMKKREQQ